jgi:hypothetical protein
MASHVIHVKSCHRNMVMLLTNFNKVWMAVAGREGVSKSGFKGAFLPSHFCHKLDDKLTDKMASQRNVPHFFHVSQKFVANQIGMSQTC